MALGAAVTPAHAADPLALAGDPAHGQPIALTTVDRLTLRPTGTPILEIPEPHGLPSVARGGQRLAIGVSTSNPDPSQGRVGVQIVNVRRRTVSRAVATGIAAEAVEWYASRRIAALLQDGRLVLINTVSGRIVATTSFGKLQCTYQSGQAAQGRAVFLVARPGAPAVVAVARKDSTMGRLTLPRVRFAGRRCQTRAMAGDGEYAYVSAPGTGSITRIRLATMDVDVHRVPGLPGAATRQLAWARRGRLVVAGADASRPAGAVVVDTERWRARSLDHDASAVRRVGPRVLTFGATSTLRAFGGPALRLLWTAPTGRVTGDVQADDRGALIYARTNTDAVVLDPRTGRMLARPALASTARLNIIGGS